MNRKLVAPLVLVVFVIACTSVSPQRIALNTLQGIRSGVEETVKVFNVGYQAGQYSEDQRTKLKDLYGKYLLADTAAAHAIGAATDLQVTAILQGVTVLAGDVIKFVQALKAPVPVPTPIASLGRAA